MLIADVMSRPVTSIRSQTSLSDAYRTMQEHDLRHLPVMEDDRLVGVVTDRDLRLVTSSLHPKPFDSGVAVREIMSRDPVTATPRDPVEEAARLMRRKKIGCLPILDGEILTGIVTGTDLLDALMRLTGLEKSSSRVEVVLSDAPGQLARLTALIAEHGLNIHSMLTYPAGDRVHVILRLNTMNPMPLLEVLRERGVEIAWPRPKPWSR